MTRRSVDLPQPFGPIRATIPPPGIVEIDRRRGPAAAPPSRRRNANDRSRRSIAPTTPGALGSARVRRDAVAVMPRPPPSGRRSGAVAG